MTNSSVSSSSSLLVSLDVLSGCFAVWSPCSGLVVVGVWCLAVDGPVSTRFGGFTSSFGSARAVSVG